MGAFRAFLLTTCFFGEKEKSGTTPVLVVKDDDTESIFPNVVPEKGANEFTIDQINNDVDLMGHTSILFKTNEPSMLAIQEQVKGRRPRKTVLEMLFVANPKLIGLLNMQTSLWHHKLGQ